MKKSVKVVLVILAAMAFLTIVALCAYPVMQRKIAMVEYREAVERLRVASDKLEDLKKQNPVAYHEKAVGDAEEKLWLLELETCDIDQKLVNLKIFSSLSALCQR